MSGIEDYAGGLPARPKQRGSGSANLNELVRRRFSRLRQWQTLVRPDQVFQCPSCGARADGLVTVWQEEGTGRIAIHFSVCDCVTLQSTGETLLPGLPSPPKELGP